MGLIYGVEKEQPEEIVGIYYTHDGLVVVSVKRQAIKCYVRCDVFLYWESQQKMTL